MKNAQSNLVRIPALMVFIAISIAAPGITWGSSNLEDRVERLEKLVEELSPAPENRWSCSAVCWYRILGRDYLPSIVASGQTSGEAFMEINQKCSDMSGSYGALASGFEVIDNRLVANHAASVANSCVRN